MHSYFVVAKPNNLAGCVEFVNRRQGVDTQAEHEPVFDRVLVQEQVLAMKQNGHAEPAFCQGHARDVIDMGVSQQNLRDVKAGSIRGREKIRDFVAGIDEHCLSGSLAAYDKAILEEWPDGRRLHYHVQELMILAIVDDLMFTSKIRSAASQLGVPLAFARSADQALSAMRAEAPSLVILDLNSARSTPLAIVSTMKGDPTLASIPTVGFVSHVQADLIAAAREAGVDEVMARSQFTMKLPEIVASHATRP
jgi:CheY-like chemotaxis protein